MKITKLPFAPIDEMVASACVYRKCHLIPVILPKIVQALQCLDSVSWHYIELDGEEDPPTLGIESLFGKTVFDDEIRPFFISTVSKFIAFDCGACSLGHIQRDQESDAFEYEEDYGWYYENPDFMELVMKFLLISGVVNCISSAQVKRMYENMFEGAAHPMFMSSISENERLEATESYVETAKAYSSLRPTLRLMQEELNRAISVANRKLQSNPHFGRG